jgi:glycosyltransferase involved in cell wall biosynthesis
LTQKAWKKKPYYWLLEKRSLNEATAIHATSSQENRSLTALGFGEKTTVIPLGVDLPTMPTRSYSTSGSLKLLFLSRIHPKKGIHLLLYAVEALAAERPGIELIVAGDGEARYRAELENKVRGMQLSSSVRFTGLLEGRKKKEVLEEADIFVLPSYHESFGIAVAEAMAYGLPVVITDAVALGEDVLAADAGLVSRVGSSQALTEAIRELMDPAKRREKGLNARRLVEQRFSRETLASSLVAFYRIIIEGK